MPRWSRRPRSIARSAPSAETAASRALSRHGDLRQDDLFALPFVPPCKPVLRAKVPAGPLWQYEIKHDGYRAQAQVHGDLVRIFTKSGLEWSDRMPAIVAAMRELPVASAVIDGEAVMVGADGISDFFALHAALAAKRAPEAILVAFDLLELAGEDLRPRPLTDRRAMLAELLIGAPAAIQLSEHLNDGGEAMLQHACAMGLEGIVAKRRDAPYRSGPSETWIKVKCTKVDSFAVVGFDPEGRRGVAALKLARLVDGDLRPCGYVGSGIGATDRKALRGLLDVGAHLVADVEYRGFSPAGELRHPVFKGFHVE